VTQDRDSTTSPNSDTTSPGTSGSTRTGTAGASYRSASPTAGLHANSPVVTAAALGPNGLTRIEEPDDSKGISSRPLMTTIIMPVFREDPSRLRRAVLSVKNQTSPFWELIIISDDGIDYRAVVTDLVGFDARFRFASTGTTGAGPSLARNIALSIAKGEAIGFLDSDDFMDSERIETMLPLAMRYGIAIDNSKYWFDGSSNGIIPGGTILSATEASGQAGFHTLGFFINIHFPLIAMYSRRRFPRARYDESVRFAEDVLFNYSLLHANGGGYFHPSPLHNYLIRPQSLSHTHDSGQRADDAYNLILHSLAHQHAPPILLDAFAHRRAINHAYMEWLAEQPATEQASRLLTFHEFIRQADGPDPALVLPDSPLAYMLAAAQANS
jgi:succinoglycan biosynthesis protein ExoO